MQILIKNGYVVSLSDQHGVIVNGYVLVKDNMIEKIGEGEFLEESTVDRVIDAGGRVIAPGMVNAHMHCYSTFARGMDLQDSPPSCFVEILDKLWWRLDKKLVQKDLYYSTLIPILEGIRCGITTFIDHHASPYCIPGCLDELERAFKKGGMRGILCYETSDRDGKKIANQGIDENIRFIKKHNFSTESTLRGSFGLHASFTVGEETLEKSVQAVNELDTGFHLHVAEDQADQVLTLQQTKQRVVKRLAAMGVLGPKTIAAHAVCVDDEEKELLAQSGTWTIHNPRSNMNNAVGVMDFLGLMGRGTKIGLGTDGMAASLWPDLRTAAIIHKHEKKDPRVMWPEILTLIQTNHRLAELFFGQSLGVLASGSLADIVIYDYLPPTPLTQDNLIGHLLFGFAHVRAQTVIINGKIILQDGYFPALDEKEVAAKSREQATEFWKRFHA